MILNLGQRWARQENKAANYLSDRALESSHNSQLSVLMYACRGERGLHKGWGSQARGIYLDELICFSCFSPPLPISLFLPLSPGRWLTPALPWYYHFPDGKHTVTLKSHCSVLDPCIAYICSLVCGIQTLWWEHACNSAQTHEIQPPACDTLMSW